MATVIAFTILFLLLAGLAWNVGALKVQMKQANERVSELVKLLAPAWGPINKIITQYACECPECGDLMLIGRFPADELICVHCEARLRAKYIDGKYTLVLKGKTKKDK